MKHRAFRFALGVLAGVGAVAFGGLGCGGEADCAAGNGTLQVQVSGVPAGSTATVHVHGPSGDQTLSATQSLTVASGSYELSSELILVADPLIRTAYKAAIASSPSQVCGDATTTVTVAFAPLPTSHRLWWGNANGAATLLGYDASVLGASGSPGATVLIQPTGGVNSQVFDREGNLWVADGITSSTGVQRYPGETFSGSGSLTPDVVITSSVFHDGVPGVGAMAFDGSGNLWVSVPYANEVVRLGAATLTETADVTPSIVVSGYTGPLAFDASGNLWIGADDHLVEFAAARLSSSPTGAPDVDLTAQTSGPVVANLGHMLGLAFDASGNLWVNYDGPIARFTPAERAASGMVTPGVLLNTDVTALPEGLAFDEGGGLWVANQGGSFGRFGPDQLTTSSADGPERIVTSADVGSAGSPALFPAPAGLPLYSSLPAP